jgi:hypothetical protein
MAQNCFCGCGREVKGFAARGMNKQGRRTVELIQRCRAAAQDRLENKERWGDGDVMPVV